MANTFKKETNHGKMEKEQFSPKRYSNNSVNNTSKYTTASCFWDCDGFY